MPIAIVCPECAAKIRAPDAAAGKRVRCPRPNCGAVISVPSPEFGVVDEAPAPFRPPEKPKRTAPVADETEQRKRPRRASEDDDSQEDDEEEFRPVRRKKGRKAQGVSPVLIVGGAILGLFVVGGVGYGIYELVSKGKEPAIAATAPPSASAPAPKEAGTESPKSHLPVGWSEYRATQDPFTIQLPNPAQVTTGRLNVRKYIAHDEAAGLHVMIYAMDIPADTPPEKRKEVEANLSPTGKKWCDDEWLKEVARFETTLAGRPAIEIIADPTAPVVNSQGQGSLPRAFIRALLTEDKVYTVFVTCLDGRAASAYAIFDTFRLVK